MYQKITINQKKIIELGLVNINQAIIFDYLSTIPEWAEPVYIKNVKYYWIARSRIQKELPLLSLELDTIYRHFKGLESLGLILYTKSNKKDLIALTQKGENYYDEQ